MVGFIVDGDEWMVGWMVGWLDVRSVCGIYSS